MSVRTTELTAEMIAGDVPPETTAAVLASNGQWSFVLRDTCARLERERNDLLEMLRVTRRRLDDAWLEIEELKK